MTISPPQFNFPFLFNHMTGIVPFTERDGMTFEKLLYAIIQYVGELTPEMNKELEAMYAEFQKAVANAESNINQAKDEWQRLFDEFMENVVVRLEALNDEAVANLVKHDTSKLRGALDSLFVGYELSYQLYVNPLTGSDTATGTVTAPFKTVARAMKRVLTKALLSDQLAQINLAAGGYSERHVFPDYTPFGLNVKFKGADVGGHPNTPITVFTEGDGAKAVAFVNRNVMANISFEDIMFNGYNGTASSGGITNVNGTMEAINCHFNRCFYGFTSFHGNLIAPSGKYTDCGYLANGSGGGSGIRSMMQNRHVIGRQNATSRDGSAIFEGNYYGALAQENSTGHADWCTFIGNDRALVANISSRFNSSGSRFVNNTIACYASLSSNIFLDRNVDMVVGAKQAGVVLYSGSTMVDSYDSTFANASTTLSKVETSLRGVTSTTAIAGAVKSFFTETLQKGFFNEAFRISTAPPKMIRTRSAIELTGAGLKTISVRHLGMNAAINFLASDTGSRMLETTVKFISPTRQIVEVTIIGDRVNPRYYVYDRSENTLGDVPLLLQASTDAGSTLDVLYTDFSSVF